MAVMHGGATLRSVLTVRRSKEYEAILQTKDGWWTSAEVHEAFTERIDCTVTMRTTHRYLHTLCECGVVESGWTNGRALKWRWLGHLDPIWF